MAKIKREDMSSKAKQALAIVEPKVDAVQAEVDKLHEHLSTAHSSMEPLKKVESEVRAEIVKRSVELAEFKNTVSSIFSVDGFKNKRAREAALNAILEG